MSNSTSPSAAEMDIHRPSMGDSGETSIANRAAMSIEEIEALVKSARDHVSVASPTTSPTLQTSPPGGLTLEDLGDVELDVSIELGRSELLIEEILKLREGSVVSLDRLAGDPVDIVANGRLIARGELQVVNGKFGVRLSEVL